MEDLFLNQVDGFELENAEAKLWYSFEVGRMCVEGVEGVSSLKFNMQKYKLWVFKSSSVIDLQLK